MLRVNKAVQIICFSQFANLDNKPIMISFNSRYENFSKQENWGRFSEFATTHTKHFPNSSKKIG